MEYQEEYEHDFAYKSRLRFAITGRIKLQVTLLSINRGHSYRTLQYISRMGKSSTSKFVSQICHAIYKTLKEYIKVCAFIKIFIHKIYLTFNLH